jgi:FG-GAP repeat
VFDTRGQRLTLALVSALALAVAGLAVAAVRGGSAPGPARGATGHGWEGIPSSARAAVSAALGRDDPAFAVRASHGALVGHDLTDRVEFRVERDGLAVSSGAARFDLSFLGVARGRRFVAARDARPTWTANRIVLDRGAVREWYVNGPLGVEQGFTLLTRPGGSDPGRVRLALRLSGNVNVSLAGHTGLTLSGPDGASLRYSGLSVTDARGRTLPASLGLRSGLLTIALADRGARYPITVDPYIRGAELTDNDNGHGMLGYSVAIDGNTIVAGAPQVMVGGHPQQGAVYVFTKPAGGWSNATQTAKLTASDGQPSDFLGGSVAVSGDTVVTGAPYLGGGVGAVYVFVEPASGWKDTTESAKLTVAGGGSDFGELGYSVAVSGNTVVAGAASENIGANVQQGAAYVFLKPGSGWHSETQNAELTASGGQEGDELGRSVAIDSGTVVSGAEFAGGERGAAYVFARPAAGWPAQDTQTAKLTVSGGPADRLGTSVAISGDTVVAGAPGVEFGLDQGQGEAYVFVEPAGGWTDETPTAELVASNGQSNDQLGESVAIDASTIVAGAPGAALNQGAAYLFVRPSSGWVNSTETVELTSPTGGESPALGSSLGISGQEIVAGAPGPPVAVGTLPGAAFVFGPTPPVTSVSLSPAAPNGRNGWYISPVQVAVSASDDVSTVAATSCVLDPVAAPIGFGSMPTGCPFAGAGGGAVAGDGAHSVYASSSDSAGDAGAVFGASFRIDRTPPTVTCGPTPTFVLGKPGEVTATVSDATSGPASNVVAARANASNPGTGLVTLTGFDTAGNAATLRCPYRVLAPRIDARLSWQASQFASFTVLTGLTLVHVPSGAHIALVCKGEGCSFGHYAVRVAVAHVNCKRHRKQCKRTPVPALSNVNLLAPLGGRHLGVGTRLAITVTKKGAVGAAWTLSIRAGTAPRETGPTCLAPGSSKPGRGC